MNSEPSQPAPHDGSDGLSEVYRDLVGRDLGEYRLERVIGHGSMGVVYEARHQTLGRRVALKVLPPKLAVSAKTVQRFLREAQQVARLEHDNIVKIYDIGQQDDVHFFAMQLLEGQSLDHVLRTHGAFDPERAAHMSRTAARAVHFAHLEGIIHRDIKPGNILLLNDGRVVLTDFGLARPERGASITDSGAMVGTPLYMSPEQIQARKEGIDRRTDIYSLGATLYELLTGRPPHQGETTQEILRKILDEEPHPLRRHKSTIPVELESVVLKALEKDPRGRYLTAGDFAKDLQRYLEGEPVQARRVGFATRLLRRAQKHRTISLLTLGITLMSLVAVLLFFFLDDALQFGQEGEFQRLIEQGQSRLAGQAYLDAEGYFRQAYDLRPDDVEAQLGLARSLLEFGRVWSEQLDSEAPTASLRDWEEEFVSPRKLFLEGIDILDQLAKDRSQPPAMAMLCRAGLYFQLSLSQVRDEQSTDAPRTFERCLVDVAWADRRSREEQSDQAWETQSEVAKLRYLFATEFPLGPLFAEQMLEAALGNASAAIRFRLDHHPRDREPRILSQLYGQRSRVLRRLFEHPIGSSETLIAPPKMELYLETCESDAAWAHRLWRGNEYASNTLRWSQAIHSTKREASDTEEEPEDGGWSPLGVFDGLTALITQPNETARLLGELLDDSVDMVVSVGTDEGLRDYARVLAEDLFGDRSTLPPEDAEQRAAEGLVAAVRLRRGLPIQPARVTACCKLLQEAQAGSLDNALLEHERSFLHRRLEEWDEALASGRQAVAWSPENPVFRASLTTLLMTMADRRAEDGETLRAEAREHAETLLEQYPGVVTFEQLRSRLGARSGG